MPFFSRESNSTITNACPSVRPSPKPLNSLKWSSFIIHPSSFFIHPSSFIILHFATFKLFSLFNRCFTYFSLYWQYSDKSWHYVKDTPRMGVYFCKIIWQVAGAASVSVGDNLVVDNLVDCWFLPNFHCLQSPNIHWLQSPSVSLFKRWLKNALLGQIDMQQECKRMLGSTGCPKKNWLQDIWKFLLPLKNISEVKNRISTDRVHFGVT